MTKPSAYRKIVYIGFALALGLLVILSGEPFAGRAILDAQQQIVQSELRRAVDDLNGRLENLQAELARKGMSEEQRVGVERARRQLELLYTDVDRLGQAGDNKKAFKATQDRILDNEESLQDLLSQLEESRLY